ncbi:serine hydrolase-domain-containing protein [Aspergillus nidulans var. acristatus]
MLGTLHLWPTPAPSYNGHEYSWTKPSPSSAPRHPQSSIPSFQSISRSTTVPTSPPKATDSTLHLPRILCLHGGGTNARIFHSQCRVLRARLSSHFRLVFAEAPFPSAPGPDVVSVYAKWGPFKAWFPSGSAAQRAGASLTAAYAHALGQNGDAVRIDDDPAIHDFAVRSIRKAIEDAMNQDNELGATGDWVGVLGFSQGAKMAASILLQQQKEHEAEIESRNWGREWAPTTKSRRNVDYRFAVLLAGRAPMVSLSLSEEDEADSPLTDTSYGTAFGFGFDPALYLPTIHVHGLKDPGLPLHRDLLDHGCEYGSTKLIEWEGGHRVPIKSQDVVPVVQAMLDIARKAGVIP